MQRRTLLATVGATLAVGAAGCVSDGDGDGGAAVDDPTTDPRTDSSSVRLVNSVLGKTTLATTSSTSPGTTMES
jgi:hypothetical protein